MKEWTMKGFPSFFIAQKNDLKFFETGIIMKLIE